MMLNFFLLCTVMVYAVHTEPNPENAQFFCTSTHKNDCAKNDCAKTETDSSFTEQETNRRKERTPSSSFERTLILLKPDAVQRKLVGKIIDRFENKGLRLVGMKMSTATRKMIIDHYVEHKDRDFFGSLVEYMATNPVIAMIWEGPYAIKGTRSMLGVHDPMLSAPGTIRFDFSSDIQNNVIHGSDSVESANREINIWFKENEVMK